MNEVYTTEKLLSILKEAGYKAYKKVNRNTVEYSRLQMHLPTEIGGKIYNSFNDYINYKVVEYLTDNNIEAFVNNDNQIELFVNLLHIYYYNKNAKKAILEIILIWLIEIKI